LKALFVLFATVGVILAGSPEQDFISLLDAVYSADAESFQNCMSAESNGLIDMMLTMIKLQPEDAVTKMYDELGVTITAEEISGFTSEDFIEMVLASPGFSAELPPRQSITVVSSEINGNSSTVSFNITDMPQPFELLMIKEGETWKLDQGVIQAEF